MILNSGTLLFCPMCARTEKPQVLGRLFENGDFMILRFHQGTTVLRSGRYSISCGCGFTYHISGKEIEGTMIYA